MERVNGAMPAKHSRHIALTGPLATWAESQVANGEYGSVSELIRTALRRMKAQDETQLTVQPLNIQTDQPQWRV